jgi:hypothetical protein
MIGKAIDILEGAPKDAPASFCPHCGFVALGNKRIDEMHKGTCSTPCINGTSREIAAQLRSHK